MLVLNDKFEEMYLKFEGEERFRIAHTNHTDSTAVYVASCDANYRVELLSSPSWATVIVPQKGTWGKHRRVSVIVKGKHGNQKTITYTISSKYLLVTMSYPKLGRVIEMCIDKSNIDAVSTVFTKVGRKHNVDLDAGLRIKETGKVIYATDRNMLKNMMFSITLEPVKYLEPKPKKRPREEMEEKEEKPQEKSNSTAWECSICMEPSTERIVINCGHSYCSDCVEKISECSLCRESITKRIKLYE